MLLTSLLHVVFMVEICKYLSLMSHWTFNLFSRHPSVKWAQRSDNLFITVQLPDAQDVKLKIEPEGKFFFSATSGVDKIPYEVELDLLDKVIVEVSTLSASYLNLSFWIYFFAKYEVFKTTCRRARLVLAPEVSSTLWRRLRINGGADW